MPHLIHAFVPHREKSGISPVAHPGCLCLICSGRCCHRAARPHASHPVGTMVSQLRAGGGSVSGAVRCVDGCSSALRSARIPLWIPVRHPDRTLAGGRRPWITDGWTAVAGGDLYRGVRSRKRGGRPRRQLNGRRTQPRTPQRNFELAEFLLEHGRGRMSFSRSRCCQSPSRPDIPDGRWRHCRWSSPFCLRSPRRSSLKRLRMPLAAPSL